MLNINSTIVSDRCSSNERYRSSVSIRIDMRVLVVQSLMVLGGLVMAQRGDDRCLLESGGSTQRFFVKEDLPVGSVLGKLSVKGE